MTLVAMAVTVLTLGAAIDFSHIYLVQNELQAMTDEIALNAARELDGTVEGLKRARRTGVSENGSQRRREWFSVSTDEVSEIRFRFQTDPEAAWQATPAEPAGQRFVEVLVEAKAKLFFLPMIPAAPATQRVVVRSVAGQVRLRPGRNSSLPFSITGSDPAAAEFGFEPGQPVSVQTKSAEACGPVLAARSRHDTDTAAVDYWDYVRRGNGQRVLTAEVRSPDTNGALFGYATLLISPDAAKTGECAASYIGSSPVLNARRNGAGPAGLYEVRLFE
jgi:hypothetical protein